MPARSSPAGPPRCGYSRSARARRLRAERYSRQTPQQNTTAQNGAPAGTPGATIPPGAVEIVITNRRYPQLKVFHVDALNQLTLFAEIAAGQTVRQPARPSGGLTFAVDNNWVEGRYTITGAPQQTIDFQPDRVVVNGNAGGQPQAQTGNQPQANPVTQPQTQAPPPGTVAVTVTNRTASMVVISAMPQTPGGQPDGLADLAALRPVVMGGYPEQ